MKKLIRLTESDLHRIIEGAVKRTINEIGDTNRGQYMLGRLAARKYRNDGNDPEGWEEMQKIDRYRDAQGRQHLADYYGNYPHNAHLDGTQDEREHRDPKANYEKYKEWDQWNKEVKNRAPYKG